MGSIVDRLIKKGVAHTPSFLKNNIHYEVMMGSIAYGVSTDTSDVDIYGFCIPPKNMIFPHLNGEIEGFGTKTDRFEQWQQHHIKLQDKEYDCTIYSIVKYFQLCMQNNPNMIDSLFVPRRCILHSTAVGEHLRENRKLFLHKGAWYKFKGYAYSQVHKMKTKMPEEGSNRYEMVQKYGYDLKFAYHVVRLLNEVEQILTERDLDLERNREQLKAIRRGDWTQQQVIDYFEEREKALEGLYTTCFLPHRPNENAIKKILMECLEMHYGSLSDVVKVEGDINEVLDNLTSYIEGLKQRYSK
jgi:predicted nucleotidyltransferase